MENLFNEKPSRGIIYKRTFSMYNLMGNLLKDEPMMVLHWFIFEES